MQRTDASGAMLDRARHCAISGESWRHPGSSAVRFIENRATAANIRWRFRVSPLPSTCAARSAGCRMRNMSTARSLPSNSSPGFTTRTMSRPSGNASGTGWRPTNSARASISASTAIRFSARFSGARRLRPARRFTPSACCARAASSSARPAGPITACGTGRTASASSTTRCSASSPRWTRAPRASSIWISTPITAMAWRSLWATTAAS